MYKLQYHEDVGNIDLSRIDKHWKEAIKKSIETRLMLNPEIFGKPLRQSLKNYYKLRVNNYRVIFRIENKKVLIIAIQHRSVVYKKISKIIN